MRLSKSLLVSTFAAGFILFSTAPAFAQQNLDPALAPRTNNGKPWKIGYLEQQPFVNYAATLVNVVRALKDMGWISTVDGLPYAPDQLDTVAMWEWLSSQPMGPYIEFVKDGYYTYKGLKGPDIAKGAEPIIKRLKETKDIDMIMAMGTAPGRTMAVDAHKVPVVVMSTSNAVQAGIIKSVEDPGKDHVWAHMDPYRYRRQIEIFHDIFRFKKLGIAYDDDKPGRSFAAVDDVEAAAKEKGFEIVREIVKQPGKYGENKEDFYRDLVAAHTRLASKVDAVYFGLFIGIEPFRQPEVFAPLVASKIPVFAQQAPLDVKYGALMSLARADFKGVGRFNAEAMVKILNGTSPRKIPQVYENSPNIILNVEVAKAIGYKPRFEILLVADELFQKVETEIPAGAK
jgi:ABC-type uncharacterized transport system substrate-binding protein